MIREQVVGVLVFLRTDRCWCRQRRPSRAIEWMIGEAFWANAEHP